jgi:large conductance mechanosensitive channel
MGGVNFAGLAINIGAAAIGYGNFIQAIINFLIIAWVIFMIVKAVNSMKKPPEAAPPAGPSAEEKLLTEIRDLLKQK